LIVSKGHEKDLYGDQPASILLDRIVKAGDVIGIAAPEGTEILKAVRSLLENGVRRICISLQDALQHPEHELAIKKLIEAQYPDHFLGSVPVLTGSEICQNTDDMTRTHYAAINAYTHSALATTLFKAEDELRYTQGYSRAFLICHINGGAAGVSKTRAVDTIESGPVLGIYGAAHLAKIYGLKHVVALDVGGTTAKIGVIENGEPTYWHQSDLFGIPVRVGLPYLRSTALGGGSVVKASDNGGVELGPESMGSFPGPACYALGGEKPTLTDAFVTAGLIDPEYFLGGTKPLDLEAARNAVESVARPLGLRIPETCRVIINRAHDMVADMIANAGRELKRDLSDHALFAYGGNGGLFACGVAARAGLRNAYLFALGPVFSAFGSSVSDVSHVYERSFHLLLQEGADVAALNTLLEQLRQTATRDLLGEGIKPDQTNYLVEFELSEPGRSNVLARSASLHFASVEDLCRELRLEPGNVTIKLVRARVTKPISKPAVVKSALGSEDASSAFIGTRAAMCGSCNESANIYRWESLRPGNKVQGCSIVEAQNSTYFLPEGCGLTIDEYGNAQVELQNSEELKRSVSAVVQESQAYGKRS
jgi:N-methylhydantoinase A/oxoprolinase/acetone carboxylase beta subunit